MELNDILTKYHSHPSIDALSQQFRNNTDRHRWQLKGLTGSQRQMVLAALVQQARRGLILTLQDREDALYASNDLETLLPNHQVLVFPASGKKPYEVENVDNANVLQRAECLNVLNQRPQEEVVILTYPEALYEKVLNRKALVEHTLTITRGEEVDMEFVLGILEDYEFEPVSFVHSPGQFAARGGILDVYSFANDYPVRIEFVGDEVENIRTFDPASQLSNRSLEQISIIPNVQQELIAEERILLTDYVSPEMLFAVDSFELTAEAFDQYFERAEKRYNNLQATSETPRTQPAGLFADSNALLNSLQEIRTLELGPKSYFQQAQAFQFQGTPQPQFKKELRLLADHLHENTGEGIQNVILCENDKQTRRIKEVLESIDPELAYATMHASLSAGFLDPEIKMAVYTDHQIFERYRPYRTKEVFSRSKALTLKQLTELSPGDFVVHVNHGIGRFAGLERIQTGDHEQEAVKLIYKDGDVVYINTNALHKISKYTGKEGAEPALSKLGSGEWERKKSKVKKKVKQLAFDLVELYAKRKAKTGFAYGADSYLQQELEASFLYEDTPDQVEATQAVKEDMENSIPMDRLICGDVGFGKTEIAVRAAFKAIDNNAQVALLVPTTILAMQHWQTFTERLEKFPIRIEYLNRFRSKKEQNQIIQETAEGKIDLLIGTHRILSKDVQFKNLGLLIVDEEHKFGVAAKEKLRLKKVDVDTLTLTATPIPRTLQFSLLGIRDLSSITTPPPNRQPVNTELHTFDSELIRDAIAYELRRGGQAFFVNNRVKELQELAAMIKRLVPDARVTYAHGQMPGEEVEKTMLSFIEQEYDVLVCTSIIESGLDIPNVNTMLINQAQNFGLSDLHQMRGRVGRSNRKAFCYLLAPPLSAMSNDARKRLTALTEFSDLGSGMQIAMRDLDIRGAGDILGAEQSGFINEVGYDMYNKILTEAIEELKSSEFADTFADEHEGMEDWQRTMLQRECQVDLDAELLIPERYIPDTAERLRYYRRLSESKTEEDLKQLAYEMQDRFGMMPGPVLALLDSIRAREAGQSMGFVRLVLKKQELRGYFPKDQQDPFYQSETFSRILQYVKQHPDDAQLEQVRGALVLKITGMDSVKTMLLKLRDMQAYVLPQYQEVEEPVQQG